MTKSIAGGDKFIPTSEPGERIPLGSEKPHDRPDTEPSKPEDFADGRWTGSKGSNVPTHGTGATPNWTD
jgi:hypothetical protein